MRKIIAVALALMLLSAGALAEWLTMVADTVYGSILLDESGRLITGEGEYDAIYCITNDDCEPDRLLYAAAEFGVAVDFSDLEVVYDDEFDTEEGEEDWEEWEGYEGEDEWGTEEDEDALSEETGDEGSTMSAIGGEGETLEGEGDYFYMGEEPLYALMNADGEIISEFAYVDMIHDVDAACVYAVRADGFVDTLSETGEVLLEGNYSSVVSDCNGGWFVAVPDLDKVDENGEFPAVSPLMHISADGSETDTGYCCATSDAGTFAGGFLCTYIYEPDVDYELFYFGDEEDEEDEAYAFYYLEDSGCVYLNSDGDNVFNTVFGMAEPFKGGYAAVYDDGYVGYLIDSEGSAVTDIKYSDFFFNDDDPVIVANMSEGGTEVLSKADLSVIRTFTAEEFGGEVYGVLLEEGFISVTTESKTALFTLDCEPVYETSADAGEDIYTNYAYCDGVPQRLVCSNGVWPEAEYTLIDLNGNTTASGYKEISALTWQGSSGRFLTANYDTFEVEEEEGDAYIDVDPNSYRYGMIDENGGELLECKYLSITSLSANRYWISDGETYRLVDENGESLFEMAVDYEFEPEEAEDAEEAVEEEDAE